jgi:hypothetical protein
MFLRMTLLGVGTSKAYEIVLMKSEVPAKAIRLLRPRQSRACMWLS